MDRLDTDIQILNMNGGRRHAKIRDYMKREAIFQPYVEKTPDYFCFFLDVDFKNQIFETFTNEEKQSMIDSWLPKEERWIAVCTEWKGFHIIFSNIHCTKDSAKKLFQSLKDPHNVLDPSVYNTGLRILFAPKKYEKRHYIPFQKRVGDQIFNLEEKVYPEFFITLKEKVEPKQSLTHVPQRPKSSRIRIKKTEQGKIFMYTYEQNCRNLKTGVHRSNYIYYEIKGKYKYQRCWCSCLTKENRKNGFCKNFVSDPIPLGWKEEKQLQLHLKN